MNPWHRFAVLSLFFAGAWSISVQLEDVLSAQAQPKLDDIIKVEFPKDGYSFTLAEAAKGIKISYKVIVEQDIPGMIPLPFGPSNYTPAGPSKLHPLERITGNNNVYALFDFGLAPPPQEIVKPIKKGTYLHTFEWDGRNWNGPSDFNAPKGKPFPAGTYDLTISMHGKIMSNKGKTPYEITHKTKLILK